MDGIDKLTLELLMNKTNYNKYIEKTNPEKHKEQREFHQKIKKYGPQIQGLTRRFLENPDYQELRVGSHSKTNLVIVKCRYKSSSRNSPEN